MYFRKLFWWSIVVVLWCDENFADPTDDKSRDTIGLTTESNAFLIYLIVILMC